MADIDIDLIHAKVMTVVDDPAAETNAGEWNAKHKVTPGALTNAMLANMAATTLKGSVAGGVPEDLTMAAVKSAMSLDAVENYSAANMPISDAQAIVNAALQPLDAALTDISGLAVTDSNIIVGNGTNWVAESGATARTSLDVYSTTEVDNKMAGVAKRASVRVATTANITIATALNNGDTIDDVVLATDDLVLVKSQSSPAENGVYVVGVTPARSTEFNTFNENAGSLIAVNEGTVNADSLYLCTANTGGTIDVTSITYSKMQITGELLATNNLSDVADASTARTNLGLVIGTNVQAYDADLSTWAGVTPGTGVSTALAIAVGSAGAVVVNGGALGTPLSGTVTNFTGTASININGTVGATTPAAGVFTALTANGNTILGDATTDTVTVNGYMGIGAAPDAGFGIIVSPAALTGVNQVGFFANIIGTSAATTSIIGGISNARTAAAAYTCADVIAHRLNDAVKGAGSTITNQHGLYLRDQTQGTNNYGITSLVSAGANKWTIYASGTAQSAHAGNFRIGSVVPATVALDVTGTIAGTALNLDKTITAAGTTGAQTINKPTGTVNFAIAAASLVVTNSLVSANSVIHLTIGSNDATMKDVSYVPAAGSFTIYPGAAPTAETRVNFTLTN